MGQGTFVETNAEPRRLALWVIVGVYVLPIVFSWFLLRRGYSRDVRLGAFLLAGLSLFVAALKIVSPY
ncbi:MAG: hypothetical protein J7494_03870 [Sphingobium sp.]|nr:hypothetical protein [Sphingobium sp.]